MKRDNISTGGKWEPIIGYSRAVRVGPFVHVSGCTAMTPQGLVGKGDAYAQTAQALRNREAALVAAGAGLSDVVQTLLFVTDVTRWEEIGRAHREAFAGHFPVTAMVGVAALIDPAMLVEVQALAYRPS